MGRNILLTLVITFCICGVSEAQTDLPEVKTIDVIYTVNGSMWRGTIKSWDVDVVTFETTNGLEMKFRPSEIKRVRQKAPRIKRAARPYAFPETGLYQVLQFAVSSGPNGGISATYAMGHRFSRKFGVAIGMGYENFELDEGKRIVPIFAEARGFLRAEKLSPYYAVRLGYGIASGDEERGIIEAKGGFLANPEVGIRFGGNRHANFYMGIGAHFQKAEYTIERPWSEDRIVDRVWYQRTEVKFGLVF